MVYVLQGYTQGREITPTKDVIDDMFVYSGGSLANWRRLLGSQSPTIAIYGCGPIRFGCRRGLAASCQCQDRKPRCSAARSGILLR